MQTDRPIPREHQNIKLSVTVKSRLEKKYDADSLEKIKTAIEGWKNKDAERGIQTVHVAVDDPADPNLQKWGVEPISGVATAENIKQAVDVLWNKITPTPDYLVLFGSHDIVPMFEVTNPTYLWEDEDNDKTVFTDNPYASSEPFSKNDQSSYEVPDRVIGRIPDMVSAPGDAGGNGDPAWFVDYLKTATEWESRPDSFYKDQYVLCTSEAQDAGMKCIKKAFPTPTLPLLICPPDTEVSPPPHQRLLSPLHMIKCHGNNKKDATFWGFSESYDENKKWFPALNSATLKQLSHFEGSTVVATMCCYAAQIFPIKHADTWPLASTYLRKGAVGFVGSTMNTWVGPDEMKAADWIVTDYLRRVLEGASIGRAFLESKQDNPGYKYERGLVLGPEEKETVIAYILLGDPSIHPVSNAPDSPNLLSVQERRMRRVSRALIGAGMRKLLPNRSTATPAEVNKATDVYASNLAQDVVKKLSGFSIDPNAVRVQIVETQFPDSPATATDPSDIKRRQSLEYHWCGKRDSGGQKQLCLLRVETDRDGRPWRASVSYTS